MELQAFERNGNVGIGLYGYDDTPDEQLERKLFYYRPRKQMSLFEYFREMSISYAASAGNGEPIDWDEDVQ